MRLALTDRVDHHAAPFRVWLARGAAMQRFLLASVVVGFAFPAHAQSASGGGGGSLTTFINNIANLLTGTLGQALAIAAVALMGLGMMFGAFRKETAGMTVVGIAIVFSAAWVVGQITGAGGGG